MQITLEYLNKKLTEYEAAYKQHLQLADVNYGAAEATKAMIADVQAESENDSAEHRVVEK